MHLKYFIVFGLIFNPCMEKAHASETPLFKNKWAIDSEINPVDDSKTITAILVADEGENSKGQKPVLLIRCKSNQTDLFINWNDYLGLDSTNVLTRIGKQEAVTKSWSISTNNKASFYPTSPISFIKDMMEAERLVVQIIPYAQNPITTIFNTRGLNEIIKPIANTCNWPSLSEEKLGNKKIEKAYDNFSEDIARLHFIKCWRVPAGAKNDYELKVHLNLELKSDGSVIDVQLNKNDLARYNNDIFFRSASDSAIRAVHKCSPLKNLPLNQYDEWKKINIIFDPKDLLY